MKNNFNSKNKIILVNLVAIFAILFTPNLIFAYSGTAGNYYTPSSSSSYGSASNYYTPSSSSSYGSASNYYTPSSYSYGGTASNYYTPSSYSGTASNYYTPSSYSYGGTASNYYTPSSYSGTASNYYTPTKSTINSYLPASNCSGSSCSGSAGTYSYGSNTGGYNYGATGGGYNYLPTSSGGGGMMGSGGALGLNLNYSDNDTTITDNSDNSVHITDNSDNSVKNSTTTNTCSNVNSASSTGNCNTNTVTNYLVANDNNNDDELEVICRVSDSSIEEGDSVTFEVEIKGGKSSYRIEWSGDISGDDEEERFRFNKAGTYRVSVEVRDSNGDRASDDCTAVKVRDDDDDDDDRQIIVTTGTNLNTPSGNLSSLESVYLSQVPYTGPGDVARVLGVLALIAIWSSAVAMYLKKQRSVKVVSNKIADFKEQNKSANKIA